MTRPLLAVDVDGVLNALPRKGDKLQPGWQRGSASAHAPGWSEPHTFPMRYDPRAGAKLMALAEETSAELVWLTSWEQDANTAISPLVGLPTDLPVVDLAPGRMGMKFSEHRSPGQVKALSLKVYQPDRPVLWLDDDVTARDVLTAARAPGGKRRQVALVYVNPRHGLQDKHLAQARKWLLAVEYQDPLVS